jgi:hypothetical protein
MSCKRCIAVVKDINGELAIHFPGLEVPESEGLPECGFGDFVVPNEQLEQLGMVSFLLNQPAASQVRSDFKRPPLQIPYLEPKAQMERVIDSDRRVNQFMTRGN